MFCCMKNAFYSEIAVDSRVTMQSEIAVDSRIAIQSEITVLIKRQQVPGAFGNLK